MPRACVLVKVTFVPTKAGKTPSVFVERPDDISELVGEICCKGYDLLKYRLAEIVKDKNNKLWFQKDEGHTYTFDEPSLPNGGIYGLKERCSKDSDLTAKLTASKLVPVKSPNDFERNVILSAAVKYRRGGRRKVRKPDEYTLELCVVLIRERVVKIAEAKSAGSAPATSIVCNSGASTKRKSPPPPFTFPASSLLVSLYAPIETMVKRTAAKTGVPSGKTIKELRYNLSPYIIGGGNDDASDDSRPSLSGEPDETDDQDFIDTFTLSLFRKDLMVIAMDKFPEEYTLQKKVLGPKCKLFMHKQWNTSSWMEIPSTEMFLRTLREQMDIRSRVHNNALYIRFSFGKAKAGQEFKDEREVHDYTCQDFGTGMQYSQNEIPASPYIRQVGAVKRDKCWNKLARIAELV